MLIHRAAVSFDVVNELIFGLEFGLRRLVRRRHRKRDIHGAGVLREAPRQAVAILGRARSVRIRCLVPLKALAATAKGLATVVAVDQVTVAAAFDVVIAGVAVERIAALVAFQRVITGIAVDFVVALAADERVIASRTTIDVVNAIGVGDGPAGRAVAGRISVNHVIAGSTEYGVIHTAAVDLVVASPGMDFVRAVARDNDVIITGFTRQDRVVLVDLVAVAIGIARADHVVAVGAFDISVATIPGNLVLNAVLPIPVV